MQGAILSHASSERAKSWCNTLLRQQGVCQYSPRQRRCAHGGKKCSGNDAAYFANDRRGRSCRGFLHGNWNYWSCMREDWKEIHRVRPEKNDVHDTFENGNTKSIPQALELSKNTRVHLEMCSRNLLDYFA